MIKSAADRLILISPFFKLNDRRKELRVDKNRPKIDVRIVYGKSEFHPQEAKWLSGLANIRFAASSCAWPLAGMMYRWMWSNGACGTFQLYVPLADEGRCSTTDRQPRRCR
jgi:hypothetical protein